MQPQIRLVLALHNHQPVGNFDGVFEEAYQDSYAPFLDVFEDFPRIPIALHTSGSLLEWLIAHHPEYIERVRSYVEQGRIEIIGGPFYEPILASIPRRDRIGQIRAYTDKLHELFGVNVRGMWVPERVWEPTFAGDVTDAGIEYTIVDDYHFFAAGCSEDEMHGYYFTEDEGRLLKMFPGSERLRYTLPFADPQETIDYLRDIAHRHPNSVVAFGDDGEKFGTWPETKKHVYEDGWLRRFFETLMDNADWLKVCTLAEAVDQVAPLGKVYLPNCSYREMTEWALPTERQTTYHRLVHNREHDHDWHELRQFVHGGFWRNFLVKYPESNEMYCRQREISDRIDELATAASNGQSDLLKQAKTELYRGQCNCPYWHGAFGGLYLPHLRNAIYKHLIEADTAVEKLRGREGSWVDASAGDYNLDARQEVRLAGDKLIAYIAPARGGHLYELDIRSISHNLLATLNRRPEPYHQKVLDHANHQGEHREGEAVSIHDLVHFKQPDLDKKIQYDRWPRKSLVDHFFRPDIPVEQWQRSEAEIGDFVLGVYQSKIRKSSQRVETVLTRKGRVGDQPVSITKTITLDIQSPGRLDVRYELSDLPTECDFRFGVEMNFAGMAAGADDRYFYNAEGDRCGQLQSELQLSDTDRIGLTDEWLGLDALLEVGRPADIWTFPIQTVSQSEGGFELVHQSSMVMPHWPVRGDADGRWSVQIGLSLDTAAAQARQLSEAALVSS